METIIFEFLLGIFAGTISGLLIVKRTGNSKPRQTSMRTAKLSAAKSRPASKANKARNARPKRLHRVRVKTELQPMQTASDPAPSALVPQTAVLSCPACGLQAPESLMAEHFLGSPSHKNGPIKPQPTVAAPTEQDRSATIVSEEDSINSLRHLLQMLVPPRAFGRRHEQRTVSPLSSMVQVIGDHRNSVA